MLKVFGNGRITKDTVLRKVKIGDQDVSVCDFFVAMKRNAKDKNAEFLRVTLWRNYAEKMAPYATKGRDVVVDGILGEVKQWIDKDKKSRANIVLVNPTIELTGANPNKSSEPDVDDFEVDANDIQVDIVEELPFD